MWKIVWIFIFATCVYGQKPFDGWMNFKPLESTKEDVEKLLGPPTRFDGKNAIAHYESEKGTLHVHYSLGKCDTDTKGWSVPTGLVTQAELMFEDTKLPPLSDYLVNSTKFVVIMTKDAEFFYKILLSPDRSTDYAVTRSKKRIDVVSVISLGPPKKDWDKRCK